MPAFSKEFREPIGLKKSISDDEILKKILMLKLQNQDLRLDELSDKLDNLNFKVNNLNQSAYNYNQKPIGAEYAFEVKDDIMTIGEDDRIIQDIICEVEMIKKLDDIRDQIALCACISDKCLKLLKIMKRNGEVNQRKSTIHLFFQAIKRNYAKSLFTSEQVDLMLLMLRECQNEYISESKYFEFDEKIYQLHLAVFPEEE